MSEKSLLRKELLDKRARLAANTSAYRAISESIISKLTASVIWRDADTVLSYMPVRGELDILPLMDIALSENKKFALPVTGGKGQLQFYFVSCIRDLTLGRYAILEPNTECCTPIANNTLCRALCIVPAISFDRQGYRMGYGGGYYDRFLKNFGGVSVGLVSDELLSYSPLPTEAHDISVDFVITEKEFIAVKQ